MMIRTSMIVGLIVGIALGCAAESQTRAAKLDYCTCKMWGVVGADRDRTIARRPGRPPASES
jgi:hypothetical protein